MKGRPRCGAGSRDVPPTPATTEIVCLTPLHWESDWWLADDSGGRVVVQLQTCECSDEVGVVRGPPTPRFVFSHKCPPQALCRRDVLDGRTVRYPRRDTWTGGGSLVRSATPMVTRTGDKERVVPRVRTVPGGSGGFGGGLLQSPSD